MKTPVPADRHALGNVTNIPRLDVIDKNRESKPMDESAKQEYSPVVPNGVTSNRYEEMKSSSQIRSTEERELDDKVPAGFRVDNKQVLKTDLAPQRFANDQS